MLSEKPLLSTKFNWSLPLISACRVIFFYALTFFKITFFKIFFEEHYQSVNGLNPDHDHNSVGLDLGPNCLQKLYIRPFQHHDISRN